jgi:hypothetical protein
MAPRAVDFRAEYQLRNRTIDLLKTYAATQVRFTFNSVPFHGQTGFPQVAAALKEAKINFLIGEVDEGAEAQYDPSDDVIKLKRYDYGKQLAEEQALIHECFHAWRDIQGKKVLNDDGEEETTYAVTDEAMAYITGALFVIHKVGTTSGSWGAWGPIFSEAHRIAKTLVVQKGSLVQSKPNPAVSVPDIYSLWGAVMADKVYSKLADNPHMKYRNNGV